MVLQKNLPVSKIQTKPPIPHRITTTPLGFKPPQVRHSQETLILNQAQFLPNIPLPRRGRCRSLVAVAFFVVVAAPAVSTRGGGASQVEHACVEEAVCEEKRWWLAWLLF